MNLNNYSLVSKNLHVFSNIVYTVIRCSFSKELSQSFTAVLLLATPWSLSALTLNEAVNAELDTIGSAPCERLLGTDPVTVLSGNLATICSRAVPLGNAPQSSATGAATLSSMSSSAAAQTQDQELREETQLGSQWTLFLTAEFEQLDRDVTDAADGFDSNAARLLAGTTYALNPNANMGLAFTTQRHSGDYTNGGDFEANTNGIRLLASWYVSDRAFLQANAGYDKVSSERSRAAAFEEYQNGGLIFFQEGQPISDFDYNQTELSLVAGYEYSWQSVTLTPQLGITWLNIDYGTYSETDDSGLALTYHDDERESLQSALGLQATMAIGAGFGVVIPQLDLHWIHEYEDKSREVNVSFTQDTRSAQFAYDTEAGDRNFFELGAGASFVFSHGNQAFVRLQTLLGHEFYDNYIVAAGVNIEL
jgi:uncharacterized protein YhjY with autotransporter beta-barrel domain